KPIRPIVPAFFRGSCSIVMACLALPVENRETWSLPDQARAVPLRPIVETALPDSKWSQQSYRIRCWEPTAWEGRIVAIEQRIAAFLQRRIVERLRQRKVPLDQLVAPRSLGRTPWHQSCRCWTIIDQPHAEILLL